MILTSSKRPRPVATASRPPPSPPKPAETTRLSYEQRYELYSPFSMHRPLVGSGCSGPLQFLPV
jgi:hypothetical protein